ncbi:hypothetical protein ANHYDRO_01388 [Anaerococcus hydrogenalis DSM 7454]|uniref:Uncharacterized protein n=1 Tax=Anaerococcus hydrogenalis DSM 7454 TaxID=561177 RepID=B6W9W2_9FIRM|nr:hypothetical protein ANHYDRO_01388 [Anaerococcus hydrogenalis DSM 7454]
MKNRQSPLQKEIPEVYYIWRYTHWMRSIDLILFLHKIYN